MRQRGMKVRDRSAGYDEERVRRIVYKRADDKFQAALRRAGAIEGVSKESSFIAPTRFTPERFTYYRSSADFT